MTFDRFRVRAMALKRRPDLDDEARRAHEALLRVMRNPVAPSGEWHDLSRRRRNRRLRAGIGLALTAILAAGVGLGGWIGGRQLWNWIRHDTGLLAVQRIDVRGHHRLTPDELLAASGLGVGQDILDLDARGAALRLSALPLVRRASVRRNWHRAVEIAVEERTPVALVLLDQLWEVDIDGVVLPPGQAGVTDLPIIRGVAADTALPGLKLTADGLPGALRLARSLADSAVRLDALVSDIWADDPDSLVMLLNDTAVPVKVGRGDIPPRRLQAFRAALDDLARRKIEARYWDLRFSGQVVVMRQPEAPEEEPGTPSTPGARKAGAGRTGRRIRHGRIT